MIAANGELQASKSLANAAKTVVDCPHAVQVLSSAPIPSPKPKSTTSFSFFQLRFLQTLNNISENSDVITFPLPLKIISLLTQKKRRRRKI